MSEVKDNQLVRGAIALADGVGPIFNDQPVMGVVIITDGRLMFNNQRVLPIRILSGEVTPPDPDPGEGGGSVVGLIANRFQVATAATNIAQNFTSRRMHYANSAGDVSGIKCVDVGWYMGEGGAVAGGGARIKRYIEYPAGVFHGVTWAGVANVRVEGDTTSVYVSDVVLSSVTGEPLVIPAGEQFFERTVNINAAAASFPVMVTPAAPSVLGLPDGNSGSDLGNTGTINPTTTQNTFGAVAMIGNIASSGARSFIVLGDSIAYGQGDVTNVGALGGSGWVARMLDAAGHSYLKIACPGQSASELAAAHGAVVALLGALTYTDAIVEYGVNDLRIGRVKAQVLADQQTLYGLLDATRVYQTTITPRTDSSNAWADVAGQTPKTDGAMADLTPLNTAIRAGVANVTGIIDTADAAMSARDSNKWAGPFPPTLDGTHPTSARAAALATALVPQIA